MTNCCCICGGKVGEPYVGLLGKHICYGCFSLLTKSLLSRTAKAVPVKTVKAPRPGFDAFWSIYPVKKGKGAAEQAFNQATAELDVIIQGVYKLNAEIAAGRQEVQYVKHPSTWLNQCCWEDSYEYDINEKPLTVTEQDYVKQAYHILKNMRGYCIGDLWKKIRDTLGENGLARVRAAAERKLHDN